MSNKVFELPKPYVWFIRNALGISGAVGVLVVLYAWFSAGSSGVWGMFPVMVGFFVIVFLLRNRMMRKIRRVEVDRSSEIISFRRFDDQEISEVFADIIKVRIKWSIVFQGKRKHYDYPDYENRDLIKELKEIFFVEDNRVSKER